jgi:CheY-like chemotaxis protein
MQPYKYDKVLIVDDTTLDCFIAERVMRHTRFAKDTICINSASDALTYLGNLSDNSEALPELIFLDVNMPGMSGFQFLYEYQKLRGNMKKRSVVMLTSSMMENEKEDALRNEYVRSFINKPLSIDALEELEAVEVQQA